MMANLELTPSASTVADHLRHITRRWHELGQPVLFEIRFLTAEDRAQVKGVARFRADEQGIKDAAEHVAAMNVHKLNAYVVVNPIDATARIRAGEAAKDEHIIASFFHWADADDAKAAENIRSFVGPKPTFFILTGTKPSARPHVYWELEEPTLNMKAWRETQERIAATLKTDPSVVNASRIMRIGGTVNWPKPKKIEKGYIPEITHLVIHSEDDRPPVTSERMVRAFAGATSAPLTGDSGLHIDTGQHGKAAAEYADILRRARTDGEKHTGVRDLTASLAGAGVPRAMAEAIVKEACPVWDKGVEDLIGSAYAKFYPVIKAEQFINLADDEEENDWLARLIVNSRGRPVFNTANAMLVLENHPDLKGCFAYDEFRQAKLVTKPLPGSSAPKGPFQGRDYRDSDTIKVVSHFNRNGFPDATKTTIADAIDAVAEQATFHPVRNYLNDLPEWDGVKRIDGWLQDYCNVEPQTADEIAYTREVASKWLISAVARVMRPGCKADGVLILEGSQGARKSTTLRFLAGDEWFGDSLPPMSSKDASDYLRGKWVIEMAELSNINKAEVEVVKAFISRENERFRPAYARTEITYPRQCVFAGSTNKSDYLRDETGNRRFWPVKVNGFCDTHGIKEDRDQLWAEALARYKAGEPWWLSAQGEETAKAQQEQRVSQDAWEGDIANFCVGRSEVSPAEVGTKALNIDLSRLDRAATNRITAVLATLGYVRRGQFTSGENKGRARYVLGGQQ